MMSRLGFSCRNFSNKFANIVVGRRYVSSKASNFASSSSRSLPFLLGATLGAGTVFGGLYATKQAFTDKSSKESKIPRYIPGLSTVQAAKMVSSEERTFIMIKPDGIHRGLIAEIIKRFEQKGFKLVAMKFLQPSKDLLHKHYEDLSSRPFFPGLIKYMSSGPVLAMVWEGQGVVKTGRVMLGETHPAKSLPGTIRGDYCIQVGRNIVHGSDSVESANTEIQLWFKQSELVDWTPELHCWINEDN